MGTDLNNSADREFDDFLNELANPTKAEEKLTAQKQPNIQTPQNSQVYASTQTDDLLFDLTHSDAPQQQPNSSLHFNTSETTDATNSAPLVRQESDFLFNDLFAQTNIGQKFSPGQPSQPDLASTPLPTTSSLAKQQDTQKEPQQQEEEHQVDSEYPVKNIKPGPYFELLSSRGKLSIFGYLQKGAVFWKAGKYGLPHFLFFKLDSNRKFIQWFSRNKTLPNTRVSLSALRSLKIGNNPFFAKHCNDRLLKRSLSLQLQERSSSSPIYFNSAATPKSYYEKDLVTMSDMSNKTTEQKGFFQPVANTNKNSFESLDIVCLNSVNFLVWGRALALLVNFNNRLSEKQNKKFWDVTGYVRDIEDVEVHLNLPQELIDKSYLLHRFEFFAAVHYNKKYKVEKAQLTAIEQFTIDEIYQKSDQINSGIKKIYKKLKSKKINPKEKEEVTERLDTLAADYKVVKDNYLAFGFSRTRKIYWLMYAELIAMNEAVIAITSTAGSKNSYKMI
eukprot:GAHX01000093.1.p1 GENE.GAHX01000093.1~~GAHX01000093.1.p1  ORF type:complete len:503 (-),score=116.69 GAHX01000093.1:432-1940(-)